MARALYPHEIASLRNLAELLGVGAKGHELASVKDKWELTDAEQRVLGGYCATNRDSDINLTAQIFDKLVANFPVEELRTIDTTIRMFTEPELMLDPELLTEEIETEKERKQNLLDQIAHDKADLMSNDKFAEILLTVGVDPPKKLSPSKVKDGRVDPAEVGDPPIGMLPCFKAPKGATAEQRAELKEAKRLYPWTYAFGKGDEVFKVLLDHPDTAVNTIVEARMGVKSTINETRAERMLGISARGAWPVFLTYCAATTFRFSGGDKVNPQNFTRGSRLRRAIMAPDGKLQAISDLSQIEARVLAVLAGQDDLVEQFARGDDVYCNMASSIFDRPITKSDKNERFLGKATILGCFGPDTLVLTNRGYIRIVEVKKTDMVWDGVEWVSHQGIIYQGEQECHEQNGIAITPKHEILTEHGWREWQEVRTKSSLFQSALKLVNSSYLNGCQSKPEKAEDPGSRSVDAHAATRDFSTDIILKADVQPAAINALRSKAPEQERDTGDTKTSSSMMSIENDSSIESAVALPGATTPEINNMAVMGGVEYSYMSRGEQTEVHFYPTSLLSKDGTYQNYNSTGQTTTKDTNQATCDSSQLRSTPEISEQSTSCRKLLKVYDIAYAGPRNRFTVATDAGPIIVHNCGYGLGWAKFSQMVRIGMLGNDGIIFGTDIADALGLSLDMFTSRYYAQALESKPANITENEHLLHCACAKGIIDRYRSTNHKITALWKAANGIIPALAADEDWEWTVGVEPELRVVPGAIIMPNGLKMQYNGLKQHEGGEWTRTVRRGRRIEQSRIYGGSITENLCQCLARIVITEAMNRMTRAGLKVVMQVHDELVVVADEDKAEQTFKFMQQCMQQRPAWMPSLPLGSEGGVDKRYVK
jgi:hypothetical protein